jgi:hypothetical protein
MFVLAPFVAIFNFYYGGGSEVQTIHALEARAIDADIIFLLGSVRTCR